jgi:hypothetical protein
VRILFVGGESLLTANVHEELGKFHLEEQDLESSFYYLSQCYEIR